MLGKGNDNREAPRGPGPLEGGSAISVISKEMRVEGNCSTQGNVRVEGHVSGSVAASGVELTASGSVEGDIEVSKGAKSAQAFVIAGKVAGSVRAPHVEVQRTGHVEGGVFADEAVIHGHVRGGVQARGRLALEDTAEVEGDVHARRLALKEGGRVNGNIRMGELPESSAEAQEPKAQPQVRAAG